MMMFETDPMTVRITADVKGAAAGTIATVYATDGFANSAVALKDGTLLTLPVSVLEEV